jgi:hypothetical protein
MLLAFARRVALWVRFAATPLHASFVPSFALQRDFFCGGKKVRCLRLSVTARRRSGGCPRKQPPPPPLARVLRFVKNAKKQAFSLRCANSHPPPFKQQTETNKILSSYH